MNERANKASKRATQPARERLKREDPERSEPIRYWSGLFRYQEPTKANLEGESGHGEPGRFVADGVKLAYKIADEQIRQGQRIAEQINDRKYDVKAVGNDLRELSERTLRYAMDLTALWSELLGSLPEVLMRLPGIAPHPPQQRAPGAPSAAGPSPASPERAPKREGTHWIEISSRLPARVMLDLHPGAEDRPLGTHGLRSMDGKHTAVEAVAFVPAQAGERPGVTIQVPPRAAPGLYTGVVIDKETGEAMGTLSLRLSSSRS